MQTCFVWTIGCQMNMADSWRLEEELRRLGLRSTAQAEQADLIVLNTCVVRQHAQDKCAGRISSLKHWKQNHPQGFLVVMGCLVDDTASLRAAYPHVDLFIKPSAYIELVHYLVEHDLAPCAPAALPPEIPPVSVHVPINYGCDHHCTYCIVRLRRGAERSRPANEIVSEIAALVQRGVREVTLLGQNVDSYGHDLPGEPPPTLADLLRAVHDIPDLSRIRFLTSHPADMCPEVIRAVAELPRVCPHWELPIQAGDDQVLKRMGRGYTVTQYRELVTHIRQQFPPDPLNRCSLATDVIVGFPGESLEQYEATYRLLEELRFDAVHVAAYSERPGTPAALLTDDVPQEEKERRRQAIDALQNRLVGEINAELMGQTVEILVEERRKGRWQGRTRTNKLVFFEDTRRNWRGQLVQVRITWSGPWSLIGEVIS